MRYIVQSSEWLRNQLEGTPMKNGWGNGYIIIPETHPWFGMEYNDIPVEVHGGLTFGNVITEDMLEHWDNLTKDDIGKWLIGFDTNHYNDNMSRWPKEKVIKEAKRLLEQAKSFNGKYKFIV